MKLSKSRKALSPVVASIILIAVTVAVSIAVAAWMGALTFTFTSTEQLQIVDVEFVKSNGGAASKYLNVTVRNTGSSPITINSAWVNGVLATIKRDSDESATNGAVTIKANENSEIEIEMTTSWSPGNTYQVRLASTKGNQFYYTATAPSS
ncbi:MAG: archaellin/type IV pilin N-terminal domain-containing protein [Candidatus Bathyarchaeia archaeon]